MPAYLLTPIEETITRRAWLFSHHHGWCIVYAACERDARLFAGTKFSEPYRPEAAQSPWLDPAMVDCLRIRADRSRPTDHGAIYIAPHGPATDLRRVF